MWLEQLETASGESVNSRLSASCAKAVAVYVHWRAVALSFFNGLEASADSRLSVRGVAHLHISAEVSSHAGGVVAYRDAG
jgi:hypothetical protein